MKGVFVGSGSEGLAQPRICEEIVSLTKKEASQVSVLYVGTATYDLPVPKESQTGGLKALGCTVTSLCCGLHTQDEMKASIDAADVIVVSGGNTLYAVDYWKRVGVDTLLAAAAARGVVLAGTGADMTSSSSSSNREDLDILESQLMFG